ncbi:MAG: hypothetical protein EOP45_22695 [Sphingobacteriaceae bacterium]|nr:MAG: hypothetical protein EOP45_22695 [Sphingobacteriaceae bacterium]
MVTPETLPYKLIVTWTNLLTSSLYINVVAESTVELWSLRLQGDNMVFSFSDPVQATMLRMSI